MRPRLLAVYGAAFALGCALALHDIHSTADHAANAAPSHPKGVVATAVSGGFTRTESLPVLEATDPSDPAPATLGELMRDPDPLVREEAEALMSLLVDEGS